jgi:hypothetical protein
MQEKAKLQRDHDNMDQYVSRLQELVALLESEREACFPCDYFVGYNNALWE